MRPGHLWLASLACCPLAGWPLLAHAGYRRLSRPCRAGLAAAVGSVLVSGWMTFFALAGIAWRPAAIVVLAGLTAFLLRFLPLLDSSEPAAPPEFPASRTERLAPGVAVISVIAAFAATASAAATSPDLLFFWGPKAQAFAAARTVDTSFLREPFLEYMHASYPPLVTNLYAFASIAAGRFAWGAATFVFPLCLAALASALPGLLRTATPRGTAWAASALVVAAFGFLGNEVDVAGNGEPWLWLFETLAMVLLVGGAATTGAGQLLAGLLLAGAVSTKVEGLPFAVAAAILFLAIRRRQLRIGRAAGFLLLPGVVSLGAWFAFGASRRLFYGYEQYGSFLDIHWNELARVLSSIASALWSAGWTLPWLLPVAALLAAPGKTRLAALPLILAAVLTGFFVFTYLHLPDSSRWIEWSAGRVFSPLLALLAIASVCVRRQSG